MGLSQCLASRAKVSTMTTIRFSRGHLRCLAAMERGGVSIIIIMTVLPIFVNFIWTIIYFTERTRDVYSFGPCNMSNGTRYSVYSTPFFLTNRSEELWATQAVFTMLTVFVWAPYRYLRPGVTRYKARFASVLSVDFLTLLPFLISMVFPPAYVAYVPTFLRVWIVKYELLSLYSPTQKVSYLVVSLAMDILSITITVIGGYEWSVNNFPVDPISYGIPPIASEPVYPCLTFLDSLYWFMVTFATVGYGDVVPTNQIARMFVILFIILFLLLLPEFVNKVTTILRSYSDYKAAKFTKSKVRDYIILDGHVTCRMATQTLSVLQPKFFTGETTVGFVVVLSDSDTFDDLLALKDSREEEYTRLFLLQGSLDISADSERSKAASSKAVYVLPQAMKAVPYPDSDEKQPLRLREATELTREYCMRRDFDTIRRVWAAQMNVRHTPIRTLLMHKANLNLIDFSSLNRYSSICRCNTVSFLFADSLEQRIGAASAIIPAFGTIIVNMILGGSCMHKSFEEYEAEATDLAAIDRMYDEASSEVGASDSRLQLPFTKSGENLTRQASVRVMNATPDDEQYVRSLRHGLLLVSFKASQETVLARVCRMAFRARVLVCAFIPSHMMCSHLNFKSENIEWSHRAVVKPDDFLVCYGGSHQIDIIRRAQFWQLMNQDESTMETINRMPPAGATGLSPTSPIGPNKVKAPMMDSSKNRKLIREGDFDHLCSDKFVKRSLARKWQDARLKDTRAGSEVESDASGEDTDGDDDEESGDDPSRAGNEPKRRQSHSSSRRFSHEQLRGHVIVHSASHDNYVYFVRKLRSRDLIDSSRPILLLDSKPPNKFRWSEISHFENVYYMQGRPFIIDDLKRAGFEQASCLLLLTDYRTSFEGSNALDVDRDNLLAEKVANRLRKELDCATRIITHVACEESCEFVGVERMRKVVFNAPFRAKETLSQVARRRAFSDLARIFHEAWHPVTFSSYITGESWSPASYLLVFLAIESKGNWIASFFECLTDTAGSTKGMSFEPVPIECRTFEEAVMQFLDSDRGLVIGIFRNYTTSEPTQFRGALMFPQNDYPICEADMLYVMRGVSPVTV